MFDGKRILITGGTGTFGHAVLRRFLDSPIEEIRIFSRDEKKQEDIRIHYQSPKLSFVIGDVRDIQSCRDAMWKIDLVFHAAALKQVPSCEFFPMEAIRTNAVGADNVMRAAVDDGVKSCVVLSTDKAAYPVNAMGISKAMMEKLMVARSRVAAHTPIVLSATRYGNVMASRGSVIPLFIRQIMTGKPLTVTDPKMTRFMMSIEDAVDLVVYAFEHARSGDIFVRKAKAATLEVLIEAVQQVLNKRAQIEVIGTRHGEKLFETLLTREEFAVAEDCGDYYRVGRDLRDMNYRAYVSEGMPQLAETEDYHSHNTDQLDVAEMVEVLRNLDLVKDALAGRVPD